MTHEIFARNVQERHRDRLDARSNLRASHSTQKYQARLKRKVKGLLFPLGADLGADAGFDAVEGSLEVARLYLRAAVHTRPCHQSHAGLHEHCK